MGKIVIENRKDFYKYLSRIENNDRQITEIVLADPNFTNPYLRQLANALSNNSYVTTVDLSTVIIDADGLRYLYDALLHNQVITKISVNSNNLGERENHIISEMKKISPLLIIETKSQDQNATTAEVQTTETVNKAHHSCQEQSASQNATTAEVQTTEIENILLHELKSAGDSWPDI